LADDKKSKRSLAKDVIAVGGAAATAGSVVAPPLSVLAGALMLAEHLRERRQVETRQSIEAALESVKDEIDRDFVRTEEFAALAEEVAEKATRRREMEKREFYAAVVANSATPSRPTEEQRFRFITTLERLSESQLRLLSLFAATPGRTSVGGMEYSGVQTEIIAVMPEAESRWDEVMVDYRALEREGPLRGFPSGTMNASSASNLRSLLTDLGRQFHQFVVLPYSDVHPPT
jgi:hypothetical protein